MGIMKKSIDTKKKARDYIESIVQDFSNYCVLIETYTVTWKEGYNDSGGIASIEYTPEMFSANFYLYEGFSSTTNGINKFWKTYVKQVLSHEIGHCYIWELEGTKRDIQKVSTLIGSLFLDSWEANIADNTK